MILQKIFLFCAYFFITIQLIHFYIKRAVIVFFAKLVETIMLNFLVILYGLMVLCSSQPILLSEKYSDS